MFGPEKQLRFIKFSQVYLFMCGFHLKNIYLNEKKDIV